ncbi:restriction endonuclease subunit S [Scytonema sp. PRP1]|uniref:restriction endonuclease subunit S n=1 Tax=Scytonema sp. PRP1 TaxID=3120513 RepID=UPI002FD05E5D
MGEDLYELPKGWIWVNLEQVASVVDPQPSHRTPPEVDGGIPYVGMGDINNRKIDFEKARKVSYKVLEEHRERYQLKYGDFIFGKIGTLGKPAKLTQPFNYALSANVVLIQPNNAFLNASFAFTYMDSPFIEAILQKGRRATTQAAFGIQRIRVFPFPLPPLAEQHRIVAKIEELFTQLDAGVELLKKVKAKLKRYRQTVLKAAVEGNLTKEWREANQGELEPASVLLERMLKQRREKWEAEQLAKMKAQGKTPKDDSWKLKYKEAFAPDTSDLCELPDGWCWAKIEQLGRVQGGRQRAPRHHTGEHMRPYLRPANVFENRIDTSSILEMNFTPEEFKIYELKYGDILLNEGQSLELVGRPAIYRNEVPGACFQNTLVRFQSSDGLITEFALYVFLAYLHNGRFQKIARWTTNIAHLGSTRFAELEFPLASINEQKAIVTEIERITSIIEQIEKTINANLKRAEKLRQTILKQAFEGKLVPQDPNDEPAEKLLERIKAEKAKQVTTKTKKKTKSQPQSPAQLALPLE